MSTAVLAVMASVLLTVLTACSNTAADSSSSTTSPPTGRSTAAAPGNGSANATTSPGTAAAPPTLTTSAQADRVIGPVAVQAAWSTLAAWILETGFRPELITTFRPTATQLSPLTDQMTAPCANALQGYAATRSKTDSDSVETLTAVGITAPHATAVPGDSMVTDRAIATASADLDDNSNLIITATSSANIHYISDTDSSHPFHSVFRRVVTYTLVQQDGRWLVDTWRGTYTTSDPIDD